MGGCHASRGPYIGALMPMMRGRGSIAYGTNEIHLPNSSPKATQKEKRTVSLMHLILVMGHMEMDSVV